MKKEEKKIVIVNQSINYLTVDICNVFADKYENVSIITGFIHENERKLNSKISVSYINKWVASPIKKKFISYFKAFVKIFWLLKTEYNNFDVFFIGNPPMGYMVNLLVPNSFSILVWDVFHDALKLTGIDNNNYIYKIWAELNKKSFNKCYKFFTISDTMASLLTKYIKHNKIIVTPIWSVFTENKKVERAKNIFIKKHGLEQKFVVQYSGNIGFANRIEYLVNIAELLAEDEHIQFQIIGRGARVQFLKRLVKEKKLTNFMFLPFQSDEMFIFSLSAADLGVVILDESTSKGSVPSKSYNLMSFGIPSLYITSKDSELNKYALEFKNGVCFTGEELDKVAKFIKNLSLDPELQRFYQQNSIKASQNFTIKNAEMLVNEYLKS